MVCSYGLLTVLGDSPAHDLQVDLRNNALKYGPQPLMWPRGLIQDTKVHTSWSILDAVLSRPGFLFANEPIQPVQWPTGKRPYPPSRNDHLDL